MSKYAYVVSLESLGPACSCLFFFEFIDAYNLHNHVFVRVKIILILRYRLYSLLIKAFFILISVSFSPLLFNKQLYHLLFHSPLLLPPLPPLLLDPLLPPLLLIPPLLQLLLLPPLLFLFLYIVYVVLQQCNIFFNQTVSFSIIFY